MSADYARAKKLGMTQRDRWTEGAEHHVMSKRLMRFLQEHDAEDYGMHFDWRMGGDGDNGETLMYQMDAFFEMLAKDAAGRGDQ